MSHTNYAPLQQLTGATYSLPHTPEGHNPMSAYTGVPYAGQQTPAHEMHDPKHDGSAFYPQRIGPPAPRRTGLALALHLLKLLILPVIAVVYLFFCYFVHYHVVPVNTHGLVDVNPQKLASIKAGITSITILIISIALWPLKSLIQDLHSEEFFRSLSSRRSLPLKVANGMSIPSYGAFNTAQAIIHKHGSPWLTAAFLAGFFVVATSTLAPAALTVQTVLFDGDVVAFAVGAVGPNAAYNVTGSLITGFSNGISKNSDRAAGIAWAESSLNVQYSFSIQGDARYIIPTPAELETTVGARWMTDVAIMNPTCSWAQPDNTSVTATDSAFKASLSLSRDSIVLNDIGPDQLTGSMSYQSYISLVDSQYLTNLTTLSVLTDGSILFSVAQCTSNCTQFSTASLKIDLSGLPTMRLVGQSSNWDIGFLRCRPQLTLATREVRNDGRNGLAVQPAPPSPYTKQGNLNRVQTNMLISGALSQFTSSSGPAFAIYGVGTTAQMEALFGKSQVAIINLDNGTTTVKPLPVANLTENYGLLAESSSKVFSSGALGTAYVPGRISREVVVFASSLPHVIVSTVLFVFLSIIIVAAHWRRGKGGQFTLFAVSAALNGSHMPGHFAHLRSQGRAEEDAIKEMGGHGVSLGQNLDGSKLLRLE